MKWSIKLIRIAGIDVFVHATFALLLVWAVWMYRSRGADATETLMGVIFILAVFAIVVLHELGHALTARVFGIKTKDITLLPIGGVARLERMPTEPLQEFLVALAGPAVNVALAVLFAVLTVAVHGAEELFMVEELTGPMLPRLVWINVALAMFNLLPAFPMDGGRILRALLAVGGDRERATRWAATVGKGMALLFAVWGLSGGNPFMVLIALFVWMGAGGEARMVRMQTDLAGITVAQAAISEFSVIGVRDSLQVPVRFVLSGFQQDFPVVESGRLVGMLHRARLMRALAERGPGIPVAEIMSTDFEVVSPRDDLMEALPKLNAGDRPAVPVVDGGRLVGLLTLENVTELLMMRQAARQFAR